MSRENVDLVREILNDWVTLFDRKDVAALHAHVERYYDPGAAIDFGWRTPDALPGGTEVIIDWATDFLGQLEASGEDMHYEVGEPIDVGDVVVVPARTTARRHGADRETRFVYELHVRDRKIVKMVAHATVEEALSAAHRSTSQLKTEPGSR